jgi:hypothetical protein
MLSLHHSRSPQSAEGGRSDLPLLLVESSSAPPLRVHIPLALISCACLCVRTGHFDTLCRIDKFCRRRGKASPPPELPSHTSRRKAFGERIPEALESPQMLSKAVS